LEESLGESLEESLGESLDGSFGVKMLAKKNRGN
jgi:hypothetical protein